MKTLFPWLKCTLAFLGLVAAAWVLWGELHPAPTGTVEITLSSKSKAMLVLHVNKHSLSKDKREVREEIILPIDFNQIVYVPLSTHEVKALSVDFRELSGAVPVVLSVRLLNRQHTEVWSSVSSGPEWSIEKKIKLAKQFARSEPRRWMVVLAGVITLVAGGLLWRWSVFFRHWDAPSSTVYIVAIVGSLLVAAVVYWGAIQTLRNDVFTSETWVHNALVKKRVVASRIESPRTFVVGGSSGFFGLDCSLLSRESSHPVVNFTMHAGLPLKFYLDNARQYSNRGDSVILHLEFTYWFARSLSAWAVDQSLAWGEHEVSPKILETTPWTLLTHVPPDRIALGGLAKLFPRAFASNSPVRILVPGFGADVYYPGVDAGINEYGDLIAGTLPEPSVRPVPIRYLPPIAFDSENESVCQIADFIAEAKTRGVKVYVAFSPTILSNLSDFRSTKSKAWIDALSRWVEMQGAVCLGRPEDYQQPLEMFRDTALHLNPPGREIHTRMLLRNLKTTGWPGDVKHE